MAPDLRFEDATADADESDDERDRGGDEGRDDVHLADIPDGAGCTEIWEHIGERRGIGEQRDDGE